MTAGSFKSRCLLLDLWYSAMPPQHDASNNAQVLAMNTNKMQPKRQCVSGVQCFAPPNMTVSHTEMRKRALSAGVQSPFWHPRYLEEAGSYWWDLMVGHDVTPAHVLRHRWAAVNRKKVARI
jgi:hypothetical protein